MTELISKAILERIVLSFIYESEIRIVEPFAIGIHKDTGNTVLRAYRVGGFSKSEREPNWRLYDLNKITNLNLTDKKAESTREFYNPNDKHMSKVIANV